MKSVRDLVQERLAAAESTFFVRHLEATVQGRWYLDNGQVVVVECVRAGRWGQGFCHANSRWLSRRWPDRYRWWTGYALADVAGYPFTENHSWVQQADGTHVEVAYPAPARIYVGKPAPEGFEHAGCTLHPNECVALRALGRH
jgi:hypothetical protein